MDIAIIADDTKKELMTQFCIAYCGILSRHRLCATSTTAKYISDATGLSIDAVLPGHSGTEQITSRIAYNEIDVVFDFRSTDPEKAASEAEINLLRLCDLYNVPVATNIATAEVLAMALDKGNLDWRELINPRSDYHRKHEQ